VALVGLGRRGAAGASSLLALGTRAARLGRDVGARSALLVPPTHATFGDVGLAVRGAVLGSYSFDRYKSDKGAKRPLAKVVVYVEDKRALPRLRPILERAGVVARAVMLARDLVNEPAIELTPEVLAERARRIARAVGVRARVLEPAELEKRGMRLLLGVGAGSVHPPRLVHLSYAPRGARRAGPAVVLVGKGITFDSGGLSLKASANMEDMKADMAGAATVLATLTALSELGAPVEVHGVLALAENMPSGAAIRPGDVFVSAAGKSVEVVNTDAEGRLVLADALHYAGGLSPKRIIDIATLTGACVVALGPYTTGLFATDDALAADVLAAAARAGESVWRMPLVRELRDQLKSDVADMKNTGAREGGAITAALFLREFAGKTPWAHLDIAGPALAKGNGAEGKGASGVGVATLVELLAPRIA